MREFLITKFVCSACGKNLNLSTDRPKLGAGEYAQGQPTGALMLENIVAIDPCRCYTERMKEIKEAVKVLLGS